MKYVSSEKFRTDIEKALGKPLSARETAEFDEEEDEDSIKPFPKPLRTELVALRDLWSNYLVPDLCVLRWGDFCSVPALTDEEYDEVLEDWFAGDEKTTKFVMSAIAIFNGGGGFYVVVNTDGRMGLVTEDPHGFRPLECTLQDFLQALVAAHGAVCAQGLEAAKTELHKAVDEKTAKMLLTFAERLAPKK